MVAKISSLPASLEPLKEAIQRTSRPFIAIDFDPVDSTTLWQSKLTGLPYFPKNLTYPRNDKNQCLHLLAQINCQEIPPFESFPREGILQFFINGNDEMFGLGFQDQTLQNDFRVIYHAEVITNTDLLVTDFSFLHTLEDQDTFPIWGEYSLNFTIKTEPIDPYNEFFEQFLPELPKKQYSDLFRLYEQYYLDNYPLPKHRLGGYPTFIQRDPITNYLPLEEPYELLLQIDSQYFSSTHQITWGDSGVANFFIRRRALELRDFSDVFYDWNCS